MTINQIKYAVMIAKCASMREAADRLYITQPALTASINELEEELGILIFERNNKGISITENGREFISFAKMALNQYEILEERYLSGHGNKERFSVSTQHYNFAVQAFTDMIAKFDPEKYAFSIHETKTGEVLRAVRDMKSEIGVISYSGANENVIRKLLKSFQLEFTPLMRKSTFAYVWKDHPLASRTEVSLEELEEYPCISFEQNSDDDFYLNEEALGNYDFKKLIKSDDRATSMEIIARLNGYSIGSGMLSGEENVLKGLVSIKLKEEDPLVIGYICRRGGTLSKYGQSYIEELEKFREIETA